MVRRLTSSPEFMAWAEARQSNAAKHTRSSPLARGALLFPALVCFYYSSQAAPLYVRQPAANWTSTHSPGAMAPVAKSLLASEPESREATAIPLTDAEMYGAGGQGKPEAVIPSQRLVEVATAVYPATEPRMQHLQLESGQASDCEAGQQNEATPQANASQQAEPLPFLEFVTQQLPDRSTPDTADTNTSNPLSTTAPTPAAPLHAVSAATLVEWGLAAALIASLEVFVASTRRPFVRGCLVILAGPFLLWTCMLALIKSPVGMARSNLQRVSDNVTCCSYLRYLLTALY